MGAEEPRENDGEEARGEEEKDKRKEEIEVKDIEKGEIGAEESQQTREFHMARMQRLSATNPLRIVVENATRVASASPVQPHPSRPSPAPSQSRSAPTQQPSVVSMSSRGYTNRISVLVFLVHMVLAFGLVCLLIFKGVQGLLEEGRTKEKEIKILRNFLPQMEAASLLSIVLALVWQKLVRAWPKFMVHFILWSSFGLTLSTGIFLICFQKPGTDGLGVVFIFFSVGNGLYACWASQRCGFCSKIFAKALEPAPKFNDLNQPTYWMLVAGLLWMSLWNLAVVGSLNFYFPPLVITALVLSLAWITEVMRNVVNLTVSRTIALYYLRGMQSSTHFSFQRALTKNFGSACLGSLFVPAIEALRIVARVFNLLDGADEFMCCCARCGLKIMDSVFKYANGWAYVQIAAYGKDFVRASIDIWDLFERRGIEQIVDSDMTSAICFLTGVCSSSICVIAIGAWTATMHPSYIATISLLAAFIGYLMTRIAMALPHACVSCYYVCYAENPDNRLFDKTIQDRLDLIKAGRDLIVPTPRVHSSFRR